MSFASDIDRFMNKVERRERSLYNNICDHVRSSVLYGSATTGAPGQPVDTTRLIRSWNIDRPTARRFIFSTGLSYAPTIEDNLRGATLRSTVGGFHSVKITRINFKNLVRHELAALGRSGGESFSIGKL